MTHRGPFQLLTFCDSVMAGVFVLCWQKHSCWVSVHVFLNGRFFFFSEKLFGQVQQVPSCMTQQS